jgi:hypothetical protein
MHFILSVSFSLKIEMNFGPLCLWSWPRVEMANRSRALIILPEISFFNYGFRLERMTI